MCGRFTLTTRIDRLEERFAFSGSHLTYEPRYNIAPTQPVLTVIVTKHHRATLMRWGLIPPWAKDATIGYRLINARAETIKMKPSFRQAFRQRRCLVLADGFYEWKSEGRRRTKTPMRIVLKSQEPFAFAGIWEQWRPPMGEPTFSCAIITTNPNALLSPIHNRMPVILAREAESLWLDNGIDDGKELMSLLVPYDAEAMEALAVSTLVNSPRNDSPACIVPQGERGRSTPTP